MLDPVVEQTLQAIQDRSLKIGVIGVGYVGLPLVLRFVETGFHATGLDVDPQKVEALNKGQTYIKHIGEDRVKAAYATGRMHATTDFSEAANLDALILCVPTPLNVNREPDMKYIVDSMEAIRPYLRKGHIVSLESTTYPGTTVELIVPQVERQGLTIGHDAFVVYSPEREDPGNQRFNTQTTPKVLGGHTPACAEIGEALYKVAIDRIVKVSSTQAAEMTKLLENIYRSVNIGLVNELKIVCDRMGIDIWEVVDAASTKPFGFTPFYPGPGLGGHCIPIDPFYLTWKARQYGVNTQFIELAGVVNRGMPEYVVHKLMLALNDHGKAIKGSKVLVLGAAYKKDVDDMRESPAVEIILHLRELGAEVEYSDPHVPVLPKMRRANLDMHSVALDAASLQGFDAGLLVTDHKAFDYPMLLEHLPLIVDSRGIYREPHPKVVKA